MTDLVERLRDPSSEFRWDARIETADEIERLEHMKANLHSHIKRLEDENSALHREMAIIETSRDAWRAENAKLKAQLKELGAIARAALQKDEGE